MHHLTELVTNLWIVIPLFLLFFGEYIPFTKLLWQKIGLRIKAVGEWFLSTYENRLYEEREEWIEEKKVSLKLNNFFARILFFALSTVIVILLEIFWELGFKGITKSLERSKISHWSETQIKKLPNWAVLILFGTPFVFMELIGIFALGAFVSGHLWTGIGLYLFKVLFFIPVHFVLHVGETQLMAIPWFKRRYRIIMAILDWFKRSQTYVKVHNLSETVKAHIHALKERFLQTIILLKKAFEQDDILSPECEAVRKEILASQGNEEEKRLLYEKFFHCVNGHIQKNQNKKSKKKKAI
ncbi:MAG TPA: hypothetical protein ENK77_03365 [Epsilonproteobacteria bacterium]|nr:hypothetical protein [Campylobacterota bacterium]HHH37637.1 hypothetical protein [Campylobacterota bacterium]